MFQFFRFIVAFIIITLSSSVNSSSMTRGVYIVGSDATWPPMESLDEKKNIVGYSIDYITAVANEAGFKIEIRNAAWDGIFAALHSGIIDIIASSVTITDKRKQKAMDFSIPYYNVHQSVVVPKDSPIKNMNALNGKKVGGQIGSSGLIETLPKAKIKAVIKTYDEIGLALEDLINGGLDAVICDEPVANYFIRQQSDYSSHITIAFVTNEMEQYGFAIQKGDKELLQKINNGIKMVKEKGIEATLMKKWILHH